jgi:hypothetical protein
MSIDKMPMSIFKLKGSFNFDNVADYKKELTIILAKKYLTPPQPTTNALLTKPTRDQQ